MVSKVKSSKTWCEKGKTTAKTGSGDTGAPRILTIESDYNFGEHIM